MDAMAAVVLRQFQMSRENNKKQKQKTYQLVNVKETLRLSAARRSQGDARGDPSLIFPRTLIYWNDFCVLGAVDIT